MISLLGLALAVLGVALRREGTSSAAGGVGDGTDDKVALERWSRTLGWPVAAVGVLLAIVGRFL